MRRGLVMLVSVFLSTLAIASVALATTMYAGPKQWTYSGQGASSSFSANWWDNWFGTYGSGYDKAVTFIDNQSYGWHNTVRNRNGETKTTYWPTRAWTVKAHCVAYDFGFYGSCTVS
jgi:hypothetical protein